MRKKKRKQVIPIHVAPSDPEKLEEGKKKFEFSFFFFKSKFS